MVEKSLSTEEAFILGVQKQKKNNFDEAKKIY